MHVTTLDPAPRRAVSWTVSVITLVALGLRLYRLEYQSLWVDEVVTVLAAQTPLQKLPFTQGHYAMAHSLYFAVVHAVMRFGQSEFALRLPSVIFGTASVPLLYVVGRRWLGRDAGLAAAALLAVSPFHLYYSQEARPYAALLFFALLAFTCLQAVVAGPARLGWRLGLVLATGAMLLCHPVALAFLPVAVVYAVLAPSKAGGRHWIRPLAWVGAASLALLVALVVMPPIRRLNPAPLPSPFAFLYTAWAFAAGFSLGPSVRELHSAARVRVALGYAPLVGAVLLLYGSLAAAGAVRLWRSDRGAVTVLTTWILLPVTFVFLGAYATRHPYNARFAILALPPFLLLVGAGVSALPRGVPRLGVGSALLALSLVSARNYFFDPDYQRDDYRSAARALVEAARPGDIVFVSASYTAVAIQNYYDPGPVEVVPFPARGASIEPRRVAADLDRLAAGRERIFVLLSRTFPGHVGERLVPHFDRSRDRIWERSWAGTRLLMYSGPERNGREVEPGASRDL